MPHRRSWWSRFLVGALVLTVGMTVITVGMLLIGVEKRPISEIIVTGSVYCAMFSAVYASTPRWRERLRKRG